MKKITTILVLTLAFSIITSCSKSEEENIVDCFGDPIVTELKHTADAANSKKINFSIEYSGTERTLSNVKWTFGDGQTATGISVSHIYSAAGSYTVKAEVTTKKGNSSECSHDKNKTITVN